MPAGVLQITQLRDTELEEEAWKPLRNTELEEEAWKPRPAYGALHVNAVCLAPLDVNILVEQSTLGLQQDTPNQADVYVTSWPTRP